MIGLVIGVARMIMDFSYPPPMCMEEDTRPAIIAKVEYDNLDFKPSVATWVLLYQK